MRRILANAPAPGVPDLRPAELKARPSGILVKGLGQFPHDYWFIDPAGKLQAIQVGYGSEQGWQEMMQAKLEEVLKIRP